MRRLFRSFSHALRGISYTVRYERNFQMELAVAGAVVFLMLLLPLSHIERAILVFAIVFVLTLELVNTAFERVIDIVKPKVHPYARIVKDVMAGAVLLSAILAIIVGGLILGPHL